ncbi:MAG: TIGR04086 family membrane protein [Eubacteriales bacterium]
MNQGKRRQKKTAEVHTLGRSLLRGGLFTVLFSLLFLFFMTVVAYQTDDPTKLLSPFAVLSLLVCAFFGGFSTAKTYGRQGGMTGLIAGVLLALLLAVLSFCVPAYAEGPPLLRWLSYPGVMLLSVLGGMAGVKKRADKRRRR